MFPRLTLQIIFNSRFATGNAPAVAPKRLLPSHVTLPAIHIYSCLHLKYTTLQRNQLTSFFVLPPAREKCITWSRRMVRSGRNGSQVVLPARGFKFLTQSLLRCVINLIVDRTLRDSLWSVCGTFVSKRSILGKLYL